VVARDLFFSHFLWHGEFNSISARLPAFVLPCDRCRADGMGVDLADFPTLMDADLVG